MRWDPRQVTDGIISHYEILATDDLARAPSNWDVYTHDNATVKVNKVGAAEHTATVKPGQLKKPLGATGFFKVRVYKQ